VDQGDAEKPAAGSGPQEKAIFVRAAAGGYDHLPLYGKGTGNGKQLFALDREESPFFFKLRKTGMGRPGDRLARQIHQCQENLWKTKEFMEFMADSLQKSVKVTRFS